MHDIFEFIMAINNKWKTNTEKLEYIYCIIKRTRGTKELPVRTPQWEGSVEQVEETDA